MGDDLLRAQGDPRARLGGQRERLVPAVGVQGLAAAQHGGQGLERDADDVVVRLLGGQRGTGRLGVEPQGPRARVFGLEPLLHSPGPEAAGGAELGHLLHEVVVNVEEEAQPAGEGIDVQSAFHRRVHIGDAVAEGEGDLLGGGRARLPDVVAGDGDRVPFRNGLRAILEGVGDQPHRGAGWIDVRAARHVFLEHVVLDGSRERGGGGPVCLAHCLVERQQRRGRGVDRHRGRHLAQVDAVEQALHVIDRHPYPPHLPPGAGAVGVVAHLRGKVERGGQAGLAGCQKVTKPLVGLLRAAEAGVLPHGPEAAPEHGGLHAAGERELPGEADRRRRLVRRIEGRDGDPGRGLEQRLPQRARLGSRLAVDVPSPLLQRRHLRTPSAQQIAYQIAASGLRAQSRNAASARSISAAPRSPPLVIASRAPASWLWMFSTNPGHFGSAAQEPK